MKSLKALNQILTMSSLEIAELTGKDHKNVLADIRKMLNELELSSADFLANDKFKRGKGATGTREIFNLPKRETLILIGGYSVKLRTAIIDRWQELELEVAKLKAQKEAALKQRETLKLEYKPMTEAIQQSLESKQKEPKFYHFSNEADLINRVILGCTSGKFRAQNEIEENESIRDYLSPLQMQCFTELQRANTVYITDELEFEERKEKLIAAYNKRWRERLIEEHIALES